jgi:hypothetical protein
MGREAVAEITSNLTNFHDGWLLDPSTTGDIAVVNGFRSLTD